MSDGAIATIAPAPTLRFPIHRVRLPGLRGRIPDPFGALILRLLGRGGTFAEALLDLARVPETAPELNELAARLMHVLVVFNRELDQDRLEDDDMEALRDIDNAHKEWLRQIQADTNRNVIRTLCEHYDIELTDERQAELARWNPEQLMQAVIGISDSREWPRL